MLISQSLVYTVMIHIAVSYIIIFHIGSIYNANVILLFKIVVASVAKLVPDASCSVRLLHSGVSLAQEILTSRVGLQGMGRSGLLNLPTTHASRIVNLVLPP